LIGVSQPPKHLKIKLVCVGGLSSSAFTSTFGTFSPSFGYYGASAAFFFFLFFFFFFFFFSPSFSAVSFPSYSEDSASSSFFFSAYRAANSNFRSSSVISIVD